MEIVASPRQGVKYTSRFRWLICPKSVLLCCWFRRCRLASSRYGIRLLYLISYVFAVSGRVKVSPFCLKGTAEVRSNFSFSQGRFLFPLMRSLYFLSWGSRNYCTFSICFIYFLFLVTTDYLIRSYPKDKGNFIPFIFSDRFWFVLKPFISIVKL